MSNKELLPCPFCRGEADILQHKDGIDDWIVFCKKCGCQTDFMFTEYEAIHAWNKRNYLEKQDSSSQIPEVVETGNCEYLPEECCEKSCKEEIITTEDLLDLELRFARKKIKFLEQKIQKLLEREND